jgi:hypothetical protein
VILMVTGIGMLRKAMPRRNSPFDAAFQSFPAYNEDSPAPGMDQPARLLPLLRS